MKSGLWSARGAVAAAVVLCAGSTARAGITALLWVEVDNSATTVRGAEGIPTNLNEEGYRTFDLFAECTADTRLFVADFGVVATKCGSKQGFWTNGELLKLSPEAISPTDIHPRLIEIMPQMEFDTTVTLGDRGGWALLLGGSVEESFDESGFLIAWMAPLYDENGKVLLPTGATPKNGRIRLARVTVRDAGFLGGDIFISGVDSSHEFGGQIPCTGHFTVPNALSPNPVLRVPPPEVKKPRLPDGRKWAGDSRFPETVSNDPTATPMPWPPFDGERPPSMLDMDFNGVVDARDVEYAVSRVGSSDPIADLDGDGKVTGYDVAIMVRRFESMGHGEFDMPDFVADDRARKGLEKALKKAVKFEEKQTKIEEKEERRKQKEFMKMLKKLGFRPPRV